MQRVPQNVLHKDHTLTDAAHTRVFHIVLLHIFEHIVADQTDVRRNVGQCHGEGGQDERVKALVPARRQEIHLDGDQPHEEKSDPVCGHRRRHKDKETHSLVDQRVLVDRTEESDGQRDQDDEDERRPRQLERRRQTAQQLVRDAAQRVDIAEAEIPVQHIPHPCEIADEIRLVQPQLRPCLGDHLVADDGDLPHAQCHLGGIGGDETDEREADERNRNEQRDRQQNAPNDILFHNHTISIAHRTQEKDCRTCRDSPPHPKIITSSS